MNLARLAHLYRETFLIVSVAYAAGASAACTLSGDHEQYVNITLCGASTASADNKDPIDAALAAAYAGHYPGIYAPLGVFLTSGGHAPQAGVGIRGRGTLKLTSSSSSPIVETRSGGITIHGLAFDLSGSKAKSRVAIEIDGGSSDIVISDVTVSHGRIVATATNGRPPPTQINIRNNVLNSAIIGGTAGGAIEIDAGTSHFLVTGNRIDGGWRGPNPGDGAGITVGAGASYGQIAHNDSYTNTGSGIYIRGGAYISVIGNNCSGNGQSGIGINSELTPPPGRLSITGNICHGNLYDGIDVNEASGPKSLHINIEGNDLESNGPPPGGGGTGINVDYAANVTIASNTVFDNATAGINLYRSRGIAVTGNVITSNSRTKRGAWPGVLVNESSYNTFVGNISTNGEGVQSQSHGILEKSTSDWNTYVGNSTQNNVSGGLNITGSHDLQSGNL